MNELAVVDDTSALDSLDPATREIAITQLLDRAKQFMDAAMSQPDAPRLMADFKAQIIAVAEYAKQKRVSHEIQLDATVMVRRSERALGIAVRDGQERGEIMTRADGSAIRDDLLTKGTKVSPAEYIQPGQALVDTYAMASAGTDEFDAALESARAERNVSRANVVRKVAEANGDAPPEPKARANPNKTTKTMERLTESLWGFRQSLQSITEVDTDLDPAQVTAWMRELSQTSTELNRIKNLLKGNN